MRFGQSIKCVLFSGQPISFGSIRSPITIAHLEGVLRNSANRTLFRIGGEVRERGETPYNFFKSLMRLFPKWQSFPASDDESDAS